MSAVPVSVVIICYNAAATIEQTLAAALLLTPDVVVVDSGSTDDTQNLITQSGATLIHTAWKGFGANKNLGNKAAKGDWVLSIDADETLSPELIASVKGADFSNPHVVYHLKRLNYLSKQLVRFGDWRNDWTPRLFNRSLVQWDNAPVHEKLIVPRQVQHKKLQGLLHHYTAPSIEAYNQKLDTYATLVAEKYFSKNEKGALYKIYLSPIFSFLKSYLLYGGVLDKKRGFQIAKAHANYTFKKYKKLAALQLKKKGSKL